MNFRIAISTSILCASFFGALPALAADETLPEPSEEVATRIYRVCQRMDERDKLRCEARQLERWRNSLTLERTPRNAIDIYDNMDLGKNRLRQRLQERRLQQSAERGEQATTYRQMNAEDDINTARHSYLKDYRVQRLQCMLERPGRPRAQCFDRIGNEVRDAMRAARGSRQYPSQ